MILFLITIDTTETGLSLHYQAEGQQGSPAEGKLADAIVESLKSLEQSVEIGIKPASVDLGEGRN